MKRLIIAALALGALAAPALGADLPRKAPAYVSAGYSWTGFYAGINGGYAWGNSAWTLTTGGGTGNFNINGPLVGGTIGYNLQTGAWVWGLEADLDWTNIKGSSSFAGCAGGFCETKNSWLGTARGRIGYAFDRFLPYITGGAAFGNEKLSTGAGAVGTTTRIGWTLGAGLEFAISGPWTAKIEYLYADLGKATCDSACNGGGTPFDVTFKTNIVRAGINYRF
ncbi:MAG TPA: outer membrane protein [Pseudolabrys sp.]|nr:outer membrane protein [Pseudolabrys sp.]